MSVDYHGTIQGYYSKRCRCERCGPVGRKYAKARRIDAQLGRPRTVDGAELRRHVDALVAQGMSRASIAQAAGYCSRTALGKIYTQDRVLRSTVERIKAVTPPARIQHDGLLVDATGSVRRLQALGWQGYSIRDLRAYGGSQRWEDIRIGKVTRVTRGTRERIKAVYAQLWGTDGGRVLVKDIARRNGWLPGAAFDDMDDPACRPLGVRRGA